MSNASDYNIGVYYFPNYHVDPRNEKVHGEGWTEWQLVKHATPRFPGHVQPKVPLWGHDDEADPKAMERRIAAAADHGIDHFIFDWYYYDDGPFLQRALDEGFLRAANNDRLGFALMWANHDWTNIHPMKLGQAGQLLYPGAVTRETFDKVVDYVIETYFIHPSYKKIDGCPYFSFYELMTLMHGLGGFEATLDALESFRAKTRAARFPGLHLNAVVWGVQILPNEQAITNPNELLSYLKFDSIASYVWIHNVPLPSFPTTPYDYVAEQAANYWERARADFELPYFPNVTMGWDASPRTVQSDMFVNAGYTFMATLEGNTPDRFAAALRQAKRFLDEGGSEYKHFTINAWNEWTEGSYLEPDTVNGYGYLEAIRDVFSEA